MRLLGQADRTGSASLNYLSLARRNLLRNRRRSLVTLASIAIGVAAIALFAGYTKAMYRGLRNMAIHGEMLGHVSINKAGWYEQGKLQPGKFVITENEFAKIDGIVREVLPRAILIPRAVLDGLVSNGRSSTIFIAYGIDPRELQVLLGPLGGVYRGLSADRSSGVSIADGLGALLGLDIGTEAVVLVSTNSGQANAADIVVVDRVNTGNTATNDKFILMPLALVRSLKDIGKGAEWVSLLLQVPPASSSVDAGIRALFTTASASDAEVDAAKSALRRRFEAAGLSLEVHGWRDLSIYYNQVKRLYDIIFALLLAIVVTVVALSVFNAMSMSVVERTREIGTLRAIGLRRSGVLRLFVAEALLLAVVGSMVGVGISALAGWLITAADIRYVPPGNSLAIPVYVSFDLDRTLLALAALAFLAVAAALAAARKAAWRPIVDSLTHA